MRTMKLFALALAMGAIAGCGGGGGPSTGGAGSASTMTVTLATGSGMSGGIGTTTYTEGPINNFGYYDPSFSGDIAAGAGMLITMCSGVTGAGPCNVLINVNTSGWTPGGYLVTGGTSTTSTYLLYMEQGQYFDGIASKGTVTLTSVGNVGEPIEGSFQAILALRTNSSTTIEVSGVFSVVRDH